MNHRGEVHNRARWRGHGEPINRHPMFWKRIVQLVDGDSRKTVVLAVWVDKYDSVSNHVRQAMHLGGRLVGDQSVGSDRQPPHPESPLEGVARADECEDPGQKCLPMTACDPSDDCPLTDSSR